MIKIKSHFLTFYFILITLISSSCSIKKKMQRERKLIGVSNNAYSYLKMDRISADSIKVYYAMQTEVSNKDYRVFLNYLKHNKTENIYKICAPDSTMWFKIGFKDSVLSDSMFRYYHNHSKFDNYPVVNITKYAAVLYSEWLSEIDPGGVYEYRLPRINEWDKLFCNTKDTMFTWKGSYWRNSENELLANFALLDQRKVKYSNLDSSYKEKFMLEDFNFMVAGPKSVYSHYHNDCGFYNICGNVSEFILDVNFTKGGSWLSPISYLTKNAIENEYSPNPATGFRLIRIEKRKNSGS